MPKKHLGQHFLTDRRILQRIVEFAKLADRDTVVEVGPGRGTLTRLLAERVHRVIAIEIDSELVPSLRAALPANVEVLERDALGVDFSKLSPRFALVANLPYNVSTPLLGRFVHARKVISSVTVLVQKEVADRILAPPGTRTYGPLSVGIQHYSTPRGGFLVPPGAFQPPPRVYSRVIRLEWKGGIEDAPGFEDFIRRAFGSKRKKLVNNLTTMYPRTRGELEEEMRALDIDPTVRPERLSSSQFFALWEALRE